MPTLCYPLFLLLLHTLPHTYTFCSLICYSYPLDLQTLRWFATLLHPVAPDVAVTPVRSLQLLQFRVCWLRYHSCTPLHFYPTLRLFYFVVALPRVYVLLRYTCLTFTFVAIAFTFFALSVILPLPCPTPCLYVYVIAALLLLRYSLPWIPPLHCRACTRCVVALLLRWLPLLYLLLPHLIVPFVQLQLLLVQLRWFQLRLLYIRCHVIHVICTLQFVYTFTPAVVRYLFVVVADLLLLLLLPTLPTPCLVFVYLLLHLTLYRYVVIYPPFILVGYSPVVVVVVAVYTFYLFVALPQLFIFVGWFYPTCSCGCSCCCYPSCDCYLPLFVSSLLHFVRCCPVDFT